MTRAARSGRLFHVWWHPHNFGTHAEENLEFVRRLFEHFRHLRERYGFTSRNMGEAAACVLGEGTQRHDPSGME
jgi:hypothetical protein